MKIPTQNNASRKLLRNSQQDAFPYHLNYQGLKIVVYRNVFSPKYFNGWKIFTDNFPSTYGKKVLEIGAGTGITSLHLALNEKAAHVLATDINNNAIKNIRKNIVNNRAKNVSVRKSDIFSNVHRSEAFDVIYWNMPFMPVSRSYRYRSGLERGLFDPGYKLTERLLKNAPKHLNKNGKIIIGTGGRNFGDPATFVALYKKHGYRAKILRKETSTEINPVEFILYELKPKIKVKKV